MRIKKGDTVKIIAGKDRGKTGKVQHIDRDGDRISVEGLNLFKKHVRPRRQGEKGEVVQVVRPMRISNVMLVCPSCVKPTRVGARFENDRKVRVCKKCNATF
ncbi:MAG: 50S ribosomal protein L24 [Patescibacteria group bacterium]